jgi:Carboxypeptidase regulatory-like domain
MRKRETQKETALGRTTRGGEMNALRRISLKGQLAVICSLLMVLQPLSGAPAGPSATSGHNSSSNDSLIAIAKVTGSVERNGQPLLNGSVVSSGDSLSTHDKSALLLTSTPQERVWLGANTSARVSKSADSVLVTLIQGTVNFRTQGRLEVAFESHDGLALRSHAEAPALGQVSFGSHQEAQVRVQEGTMELVQGDHSLILRPEHIVSAANAGFAGTSSAKPAAPQRDAGSIVGTVVNSELFAVPGAKITLTDAAGKTLTTESNQEGKFFLKDVPPGSYTLHVVQAGYKNYDLPNVVVRAGNESNLYVQLGGTAAKTANNHLILWVLIGGGAVAGIAAGIAAGHGSSSSNSPSTAQ